MVTSMLEKAIEIEGLLRIIRDGDPAPETYTLLKNKTSELAEMSKSLKLPTVEAEPKQTLPDFVMETSDINKDMPEVVFSIATQQPLTIESSHIKAEQEAFDEDDLDLIEEDDIILTFDEVAETANDIEEPAYKETETSANPETAKVHEEHKEHTQEAAKEKGTDATFTIATEPIRAKETLHQQASKRLTKLKSAFSLNDRFLYARELFGGNMKMFDSTLDFIEGIEDYSIIEDYFYSELEWNPENSYVADFMETLRPQFKE